MAEGEKDEEGKEEKKEEGGRDLLTEEAPMEMMGVWAKSWDFISDVKFLT